MAESAKPHRKPFIRRRLPAYEKIFVNNISTDTTMWYKNKQKNEKLREIIYCDQNNLQQKINTFMHERF